MVYVFCFWPFEPKFLNWKDITLTINAVLLKCIFSFFRLYLQDLVPSELESELTIVGLVGMKDPPRPEVSIALKSCRDAGIVVHMLTGDNKLTAESIAKEIGMIPKFGNANAYSYSGADFEAMSIYFSSSSLFLQLALSSWIRYVCAIVLYSHEWNQSTSKQSSNG